VSGSGDADEADLGALLQRVPVPLRGAAAYHVPKPAQIVAKLDANEFPYPLPARLRAALADVVKDITLERYPDPNCKALRAQLAKDCNVAPNQIIFGNGSDELISIIVNALAAPRDTTRNAAICFPTPTFVFYRMAALARGIDTVEVPLDGNFELDEAAMVAAITSHSPAVVFLALPNNPTGTLWRQTFALELAAAFPSTLIVADEAYGAYSGPSLLPALPLHPNLLIMRTLSKVGMAGLRLGYAIAAPAVAALLEKVRPPYNISALDQAAALFGLQQIAPWQQSMIDEVCAQRTQLATALAALPSVTVFASAANLLLIRVAAPSSAAAIWRALCDRGIVVRNFDTPGATALAGCLRITIGTPDENRLLITALTELLA
jgi:histidinol-phosphate aminotransferase